MPGRTPSQTEEETKINRLTLYLLSIANIYTAVWVAIQIRPRDTANWIRFSTLPKEPTTAIIIIEWALLAASVFLNLYALSTREATLRTDSKVSALADEPITAKPVQGDENENGNQSKR